MKNLYTETQYKEYSKLMERMANIDDMIEGFNIHLEIKQWITDNHLTETATQQMDERLEIEDIMETNKGTGDCKVIEFPKKDKR